MSTDRQADADTSASRRWSPGGRVRRRMRSMRDLMVATYSAWREDRTIRLGAGLAYYGLFAIVPLLAITTALAGVVFSQEEVLDYFAERLGNVLQGDADQVAELLSEQLGEASVQSGLGVIGGISLLIAGSVLFVAFQEALNAIWEVPVTSGFVATIRSYALGFVIVLLFAAVLIASLAVQAIAGLVESVVVDEASALDPLVRVAEVVLSWGLGAAAVVVIFRVLPPVQVAWRVAATGGLITAAALVIGTWLVGLYLSTWGGGSLAGAVGGVALILVWIYYEAQIFLAGAQLTKALSERSRAAKDDVRSPRTG